MGGRSAAPARRTPCRLARAGRQPWPAPAGCPRGVTVAGESLGICTGASGGCELPLRYCAVMRRTGVLNKEGGGAPPRELSLDELCA